MKKYIAALSILALMGPAIALADSTVTASSDAGSSVSPSGVTVVSTGNVQAFSPSANDGFHLTGVSFDGVEQASVGILNFTGLAWDPISHTLSVTSAVNAPTGGTMPFCSGPMAPGWVVSSPDGGCGGSQQYFQFNHTLPDGTLCPFWQGCMVK